MRQAQDEYASLWITRLTRAAGIDRVTRRYGYSGLGPYVFVSILLFVDVGLLSTVGYLAFGRHHPLLENPFWYAAPIGLWFAVWSIRSLARSYEAIVTTYDFGRQFDAPDVTSESFYDIRTTRVKHAVFVLLLAVHVTNYVVLGAWTEIAQMPGPVISLLKFGLLIPFGYFPIIAEFGGLILASLVVVPRYVVDNGYRLQFDDPHDTGGLEPVGDLIKRSVYIYTFGLIFALLFEYGPTLYVRYGAASSPPVLASPPLALKTVEFVVIWGLGILLLLYAVLTIHSYMQRQKREKIEELDAHLREFGNDDRSFPETAPEDADYPQLEFEYLRLQKVKDTSTLPFTAATEERILASSVFPIGLEIAINALL